MFDEKLVKDLAILGKKEDRDFSNSLRRALRIGIVALQNPELTAEEIIDILEAKAELEAGAVEELDLENL